MPHSSLKPWKKIVYSWGRSPGVKHGPKLSLWDPLSSVVSNRASSRHLLMKIHRMSYLNELPNPSTLLAAITHMHISYCWRKEDYADGISLYIGAGGRTWERRHEVAWSALHLPSFSSKALHCHVLAGNGGWTSGTGNENSTAKERCDSVWEAHSVLEP